MILETLQDILKRQRKYLKLSLRNAAKLIGISHSHLYNLEQGVDPRTKAIIKTTPETLKLISEAYKINYEDLMKVAGYLSTDENIMEEYPNEDKFISLVKEEVEKYGYDLSDKSKEDIAKLIVKAIKIDEITKSN